MPHLTVLNWNFKEEIAATSTQYVTSGTPETTYYQYDSQGTRLRKITENYASVGNTPTKKQERIYIAGWELYKEHSGPSAGLTCETLSLIDEGRRFVMIETTDDPSAGISKVTRYQHPNHQGSTTLETNEMGQVITYEEYHPFGTTAYQATNGAVTAAAKRYRYTGMERDDETGLEYHNARYYISWLGRWMNCDPIGIEDGVNVYAYCRNNPVGNVDTEGTQTEEYETINKKDPYGLNGQKKEVENANPALENQEKISITTNKSSDGKIESKTISYTTFKVRDGLYSLYQYQKTTFFDESGKITASPQTIENYQGSITYVDTKVQSLIKQNFPAINEISAPQLFKNFPNLNGTSNQTSLVIDLNYQTKNPNMYAIMDPISNGLNAFGIGNDTKLLTIDYFKNFRGSQITESVAKYTKFAGYAGAIGSSITTVYSASKAMDQYNQGGMDEVLKHRDIWDATVGAIGLTTFVLGLEAFAMISNPVGWVVGLSILAYGAATFVWDQTHPDPKPTTQNLKL